MATLPDPVERVYRGEDWVAVYGAGYVGLGLVAVYLRKGLRVIAVDIDEEKLRLIRELRISYGEPELVEAVRKGLEEERLVLTSDGVYASRNSAVKIVTVPVYIDWVTKKVSYDALVSASRSIARGLRRGDLVIIESSVPPGTTEEVVRPVLEEESGLRAEEDFYLAYSPERVYIGRLIKDVEERYPKVIGGIGPRSLEAASRFYEPIARKGVFRVSSTRTAEFEKLAEGIYRDVNIALANELALAAEALGVDFYEAREAANTQPYSHIHLPGPGVGGYCIPIYPYYMMMRVHPRGYIMELTKLGRMINEAMPLHVVRRIDEHARLNGVDKRRAKITILGAAFRGDIDDTRLSPTHDIVGLLRAHGYKNIVVHDPYVKKDPVLEDLEARLTNSLEEALAQASVVVIATRHSDYRDLPLSRIKELSRGEPVVIDTINYIKVDVEYPANKLYILGKTPLNP